MQSRNARRFVVGTVLALSIASGLKAAEEPTHPLRPGCQANVAVGQWSGDALQAIVDAHGSVRVDNVGVYQITARGYTLYEDDERWLDLRDYEIECANVSLPIITVGAADEVLTPAPLREAQGQ